MDRRSFLATLLATAVLDPEKLLWIPDKRVYSIPVNAGRYLLIGKDARFTIKNTNGTFVALKDYYRGDKSVACSSLYWSALQISTEIHGDSLLLIFPQASHDLAI